ncbi:MAG: SGNH/GDSL hydrolase family protein [Clostridia bacterium]|nr:SGNH/GDSL hydrolase family protein [Clostridia bacterium]
MNIKDFMASFESANEKPLENIIDGCGLCGILRTIGCVGDSLSSGEFETLDIEGKKHYHDMYDYSWGQFLARATGTTVYNFSRGGMSAKQYMETFADEKDFWNPGLKCKAYIIALGVNDLLNARQQVGSVADICKEDYRKNAPTFAGYYAAIIQRYKEISPDAKFFFMTMPEENNRPELQELKNAHAALLYDFAEFFDNSYVMDLKKYAPVYDEAFKEKFYLHNHLNAAGYALTAKFVISYLDYIIRHNLKDFTEIGLVCTPHKNYPAI